VLKAIGQVFLVLAAAVLGTGAWLWLAGQDLLQPLGRVWFTAHAASLNLLQAVVQRYVYADLWDAVFVPFLLLAAWKALAVAFIILAVISGIFLAFARRRRRYTFRT
jgi:uncharacterized protein (DUF2062 family)